MTEFSETSIEALAIIKKHKRGISITELAKLLGVAKSNLGTRHLRPLKDAGLITENFKIGKDFYVKKIKKPKKEVAAKSEKRKLQEELSKLKQVPGIDDPDIKQKIREKVKEVIKAERKEEKPKTESEINQIIADLRKQAINLEKELKRPKLSKERASELKGMIEARKNDIDVWRKRLQKIPAKKAEIKATIIELTKPERRAKIKEAKEGLVSKKHAEWIKKSQFQNIRIGWFQNRPVEAKRYLRYLINISMSGAQRQAKIKKTYGGVNNFRAIMDTLIDFL